MPLHQKSSVKPVLLGGSLGTRRWCRQNAHRALKYPDPECAAAAQPNDVSEPILRTGGSLVPVLKFRKACSSPDFAHSIGSVGHLFGMAEGDAEVVSLVESAMTPPPLAPGDSPVRFEAVRPPLWRWTASTTKSRANDEQ